MMNVILDRLSKHPDWLKIKRKPGQQAKLKPLIESKCIVCGAIAKNVRAVRYCSANCIKKNWSNKNPRARTEEQKRKRREEGIRNRILSERKKWFDKLKPIVESVHRRNVYKITTRLLNKSVSVKNSMVNRSKQYNVKCDITVEQLRELILETYGKPCRYDPNRIINYKNMAFDHIVPMSKGGESTKSNVQIISRFSNNIKGALDEDNFLLLLEWIEKLPPELKPEIKRRLAGVMY